METRGPGHLLADEDVLAPNGPLGRAIESVRRVLSGRRLRTAEEIRDTPLPRLAVPHVVVALARLDRAALSALAFARSISADVTALHVTDDATDAEQLRWRWSARGDGIPLVIIESPFRALIPPFMAYLDERERLDPERPITVVLAELVPRRFWDYLLHNQTALRLKLRLFFRPNTVVVDVPYHL
jgi:hypothetical protein